MTPVITPATTPTRPPKLSRSMFPTTVHSPEPLEADSESTENIVDCLIKSAEVTQEIKTIIATTSTETTIVYEKVESCKVEVDDAKNTKEDTEKDIDQQKPVESDIISSKEENINLLQLTENMNDDKDESIRS
jgi:hypothetical protein